MNIRQCGRVSMLLLGGLGSGFASLVSVGPMNFSTPGIASLPAVLAIQHTGTASGCVGFFGGADITGLAACPGGFTGDGGNELTGSLTGTQTIAQLNAAGVTSAS